MISVLSGRNLILELSLKVDEKKTSFFRGGRRTTRKKLVFVLRRPKVESPKLDLAQRELISYYSFKVFPLVAMLAETEL